MTNKKMSKKCPDCSEELMWTKYGWECLNPDCDVIRVSTRRGQGWGETRIERRAIVVEGGNVNG